MAGSCSIPYCSVHDYRLIVDIEYKLKIVFIVWFGTHAEYDKIDAKTVSYED